MDTYFTQNSLYKNRLKQEHKNMNEQELKQSQVDDDEIDLFELMEKIWNRKWFVVIFTAFICFLTIIYLFFIAKPVYEATAIIMPPSADSIQSFNIGRTVEDLDLPSFTAQEIFAEFLKMLRMRENTKDFVIQFYLPTLESKANKDNYNAIIQSFEKKISLSISTIKELPDAYVLKLKHESPQKAYELLDSFVKHTTKNTQNALINRNKNEIAGLIQKRENQLNSIIQNGLEVKNAQIVRLEEALTIAKAIGLTNPALINGKGNLDTATYVDRNLLYMQGTRALEAQIDAIKNRTNDEAFIFTQEDLVLKAQVAYYKSLNFNTDNIEVKKLSGDIDSPNASIEPKKKLILLVAFMFGLFGSMFIVLVQDAIETRKKNNR